MTNENPMQMTLAQMQENQAANDAFRPKNRPDVTGGRGILTVEGPFTEQRQRQDGTNYDTTFVKFIISDLQDVSVWRGKPPFTGNKLVHEIPVAKLAKSQFAKTLASVTAIDPTIVSWAQLTGPIPVSFKDEVEIEVDSKGEVRRDANGYVRAIWYYAITSIDGVIGTDTSPAATITEEEMAKLQEFVASANGDATDSTKALAGVKALGFDLSDSRFGELNKAILTGKLAEFVVAE